MFSLVSATTLDPDQFGVLVTFAALIIALLVALLVSAIGGGDR